MKIVVDDKIPFLKGVLEPCSEVLYKPGHLINEDDVRDADALITRTRTICNKNLLEGSKVKMITTATIGYDHIDTAYCEANGIIWKNAPGCNSGSVMQYIASVLVHLARKFNFRFEDKTLGVIGIGNVGRKIVKVGEALGMRVLLNDPPFVRQHGVCGYISLEGILRECDILSFHVPLCYEGEDKTYHLVNESVFKKMLPGTILINSSRGEVVDTSIIGKYLDNKHLQAAVLDVWENEPNIDLQLLQKLDIATPHIAGYSADGKANGTAMSVQSLSHFFHLGLNRWQPENIPLPESADIEIDATNLNNQEVLCRAIEATYKVENDDNALRANPDKFEYLRGAYPLRREFHAYTVKLINGNAQMVTSLKRLGFSISA